MSILQVSDLKTYISTQSGQVKAVDGVSFSIERGEVFGLVGESGSGKSMTALSIMRLLPPQAKIAGGSVHFGDSDLARVSEPAMRSIRGGRMSIVFQEPSSALDPVFTIGYQLEEALCAHRAIAGRKRRETIHSYLEKVRIAEPERVYRSYPHQLSGGMKQRVMIAMALLNSPELVILDEPTTALDVTIQAEILDLLDEIIHRDGLSILFISHDFGVISRMCDHVAVMRAGRVVEAGLTAEVINRPREAYTRQLLDSVRALTPPSL